MQWYSNKCFVSRRVRRPDLQVYVPRPKRVSYGNDVPRSRSHSSSRTSLDSDSNDKSNSSTNRTEDKKLIEGKTEIHLENESSNFSLSQPKLFKEEALCPKELVNPPTLECADSSTLKMVTDSKIDSECHKAEDKPIPSNSAVDSAESSIISVGNEVAFTTTNVAADASALQKEQTQNTGCEKCSESQSKGGMDTDHPKTDPNLIESKDSHEIVEQSISGNGLPRKRSLDKAEKVPPDQNIPKEEAMETISISSDSRDDQSSSFTPTSPDSRESESSSESELGKKSEKMEIEHSSKPSGNKKNDCESKKCEPREKNKKNRRIFPNVPVSDVLIISDTSSSSESFKMASDVEPKKEKISKERVKKPVISKDSIEKPLKKEKIDLAESDWESLYDDSGECLVPDLMEEVSNQGNFMYIK